MPNTVKISFECYRVRFGWSYFFPFSDEEGSAKAMWRSNRGMGMEGSIHIWEAKENCFW
jgi:hypothetical protein